MITPRVLPNDNLRIYLHVTASRQGHSTGKAYTAAAELAILNRIAESDGDSKTLLLYDNRVIYVIASPFNHGKLDHGDLFNLES